MIFVSYLRARVFLSIRRKSSMLLTITTFDEKYQPSTSGGACNKTKVGPAQTHK
jgi:hypothetical protein